MKSLNTQRFLKTKQSFKVFKNLTVIIPTLNEEQNIKEVINSVKEYTKNILVVDDHSSDKTRLIARAAGAKVIHRKKNFGLTASVLEGIKNTKTKYFVVMDGDGQHDSSRIPLIYSELKNNDLVIGVRSAVPGWAWHRKFMSKIAELLGKLRLFFTGKFCNDILSGFFGARTDYFLNYLKKHENAFVGEGYKVLFDLLKWSPDIRRTVVPYVFKERSSGTSKIGKKQIKAYFKSLFS